MKVQASVKKRSADSFIVRRKGRLYVISKKTHALSKDRVKNYGTISRS